MYYNGNTMAPQRKSDVVSVSLPPELVRRVTEHVKNAGTSRSHLVMEALEQYLWLEKWRQLQAYGFERAVDLNLTVGDVERLIDEFRQEKRSTGRRRH